MRLERRMQALAQVVRRDRQFACFGRSSPQGHAGFGDCDLVLTQRRVMVRASRATRAVRNLVTVTVKMDEHLNGCRLECGRGIGHRSVSYGEHQDARGQKGEYESHLACG